MCIGSCKQQKGLPNLEVKLGFSSQGPSFNYPRSSKSCQVPARICKTDFVNGSEGMFILTHIALLEVVYVYDPKNQVDKKLKIKWKLGICGDQGLRSRTLQRFHPEIFDFSWQ